VVVAAAVVVVVASAVVAGAAVVVASVVVAVVSEAGCPVVHATVQKVNIRTATRRLVRVGWVNARLHFRCRERDIIADRPINPRRTNGDGPIAFICVS
jgi:hypothetical protein